MTDPKPSTEELIRRAATDPDATEQLLDRHRDRLRRMVAVRLDHRLNSGLDPSDVVQDVLMEATVRLPQYLIDKPIAFYPWLRRLAWERIVHSYRNHVEAQRRSVSREQSLGPELSDRSSMMLANALATRQNSPSEDMVRKQMKNKIRAALGNLRPHDRELLVLRYLEQLSLREIADVLGSTEPAVKSRHGRALKRLGALLIEPNSSQG